MTYRKWYRFTALIALIGVVLYMIGVLSDPKSITLKILGIAIFFLGVVLAFVKLRCPYCHKLIPDIRKLKFCPHCGKELDLTKQG